MSRRAPTQSNVLPSFILITALGFSCIWLGRR
uniref:Uncharacterized protein n=1 Tax=Anguilla anguilla TaxID=7936 RepID=A0A0E9T798_ANGAN